MNIVSLWITIECQGIIPFDYNKEMPIFKNLDNDTLIDKVDKINPQYRLFYIGIMIKV